MKIYIVELESTESGHEEIEVTTQQEARELAEHYRKDPYFHSVKISEYVFK